MSIRILDERTVTLAEAAELLPRLRKGCPVHLSTLYRWISRGVRGVRLEAARLGGTRVTSSEAIQRFVDRLGALDQPAELAPAISPTRVSRAERELDRHGL